MHRNGAVYRFDLEKAFPTSRSLPMERLLDYAVENGWLMVNGLRIIPGGVEPELDVARYVPAPEFSDAH